MNNSTVLKCSLVDNQMFISVELILYAAIFVVSLFGNILVIAVVYRNKTMRNSTNYFIVNMAVSDLFIPIIVIPRIMKEITANSEAWAVGGVSGLILCKVVMFLSDASPLVSVLSLIFISWDRFCAVIFPFRNRNCVPRMFLIVMTWFISFGVFAPHFYTFKLYESPDDGQSYCYLSWSPMEYDHEQSHKIYSTFIMIAFIITPFFMLSFIYTIICIAIIKHKAVGNSERGRALRDRKTKTVVKLAFTIVLACAICFGPYGVMLLIRSFKYDWKEIPEKIQCTWQFWWSVGQVLAHSNAAVNPCIYFVFVQSYKKELKRILSFVRSTLPGHTHADPDHIEMNQLAK